MSEEIILEREQKHLRDVENQILALKKENAATCCNEEIYNYELEAKIANHQQVIEALQFDLKNGVSYKAACAKVADNNHQIERFKLNKGVHEKHIANCIKESNKKDTITPEEANAEVEAQRKEDIESDNTDKL